MGDETDRRFPGAVGPSLLEVADQFDLDTVEFDSTEMRPETIAFDVFCGGDHPVAERDFDDANTAGARLYVDVIGVDRYPAKREAHGTGKHPLDARHPREERFERGGVCRGKHGRSQM